MILSISSARSWTRRLESSNYDVGKVVSFTDQSNLVSNTFYDPLNRVLARVDPMGYATSFAYDAANRPASVREGNGNYTTHTYDGNGRLKAVQDAPSHYTTYMYDAVGNMVMKVMPSGLITTPTYDAMNRVGRIYYVGTFTHQTYEWQNGEPDYQADYDPSNQLLSETCSGANAYSYLYSYDGVGRFRLHFGYGVAGVVSAGVVATVATLASVELVNRLLSCQARTYFTCRASGRLASSTFEVAQPPI